MNLHNIHFLLKVIETLAKIHMVMEYAPHGELFTKITSFGKLAENEAKSNFSQIVSAVAHMVCTENSTYFCSTSSALK